MSQPKDPEGFEYDFDLYADELLIDEDIEAMREYNEYLTETGAFVQ